MRLIQKIFRRCWISCRRICTRILRRNTVPRPKALEALVADASGDEIRNVKEEWQALRRALAGEPWEATQHALRELGTAWRPESEHELQASTKFSAGHSRDILIRF